MVEQATTMAASGAVAAPAIRARLEARKRPATEASRRATPKSAARRPGDDRRRRGVDVGRGARFATHALAHGRRTSRKCTRYRDGVEPGTLGQGAEIARGRRAPGPSGWVDGGRRCRRAGIEPEQKRLRRVAGSLIIVPSGARDAAAPEQASWTRCVRAE